MIYDFCSINCFFIIQQILITINGVTTKAMHNEILFILSVLFHIVFDKMN